MSTSDRAVSVVIPVRNDAVPLQQCLRSILAAPYAGSKELIVVDNCSSDGSPEVARALGARVCVVPGGPVAALRNRGVSLTSGDVVAFIDADHIIGEEWFRAALQSLEGTGTGAVGAPYLSPASNWVQNAYGRLREHRTGIVDALWLGSGNLAVLRTAFDAIGGFDPTLEACEDVDFCNRLRAKGYRLLSDQRLRSVHHGDPTTLTGLFYSELWRGRDNVRVTLRGSVTPRTLPSVLLPVANLLSLCLLFIGLPALGFLQPIPLAVGALVLSASAVLRTVRMLRNDTAVGGWSRLPQNLAVAVVYELARALALVVRADHRTRRREGA